VVTNGGGRSVSVRFYRNDGQGHFISDTTVGSLISPAGPAWGSAAADYDDDGDLDAVVTNGGGRSVSVRFYRNDGQGHFISDTTVGSLTSPAGPAWGSAAADYDNDGDLDLFISAKATPASGAPDRLHRNDLPPGNHWLNLRLVGTKANRAAIGATVKVTARLFGRTVTQTRVVSAQNTFNGHNSFRVHVGLGDAPTAEVIEVIWPGGARDRYTGVAANRFLLLTEGSPTLANQALPAR
jgi:hypothetical protein